MATPKNKLRGSEDISEALIGLGDEVAQGKIVWSAVRKGALVIRDKIIDNYQYDNPETELNVRDYVGVQRASRMAKARQSAAYRVGIQGGAKKNPDTPYYWRMIEFGTEHVPARPFVRPAATQSENIVYMVVSQEIWKGIERVVRKRARAAKKGG